MTKLAGLLTIALVLTACDERAPDLPAAAKVENSTSVADGAAAAKGCAADWIITIDRASFATDGQAAPADRLAAFEQSVLPVVRQAVDEACAAGEVDAVEAKAIRTLSIANDLERDTPKFYADVDDPTRTVLADAFVARDFAIASEMELRAGMQCLTTMTSKTCGESIQ